MTDIESVKKEYETILSQLSDPELISNWPAGNAMRSIAGRGIIIDHGNSTLTRTS